LKVAVTWHGKKDGNWIYNAQHCCKAFKLYCVSLLKQLSV